MRGVKKTEILTLQELSKVSNKNSYLHRVLDKEEFDFYFFEKKLSRKRFMSDLKIGHRVYYNSLEYWYPDFKNSELSRQMCTEKMSKRDSDFSFSFSVEELNQFKRLQVLYPELQDLVSNYHLLEKKKELSIHLFRIYSELFEFQVLIKSRIKDIRRKLHNKGDFEFLDTNQISFSGSKVEFLISKFLKSEKIQFERQFKISKSDEIKRNNFYYYDFYFPELNLLLEIDGGQHNPSMDQEKEEKAIACGYKFNRIVFKKLRIEKVLIQVQECLHQAKLNQ